LTGQPLHRRAVRGYGWRAPLRPAIENTRRNLASNIARLRASRRGSQQQTADAIGIDLKHLQKLEYSSLNPPLRTVVATAEAFSVSLARLLRQSTGLHQNGP
jgi:transcriptional regulator with XRE-family HTH domain